MRVLLRILTAADNLLQVLKSADLGGLGWAGLGWSGLLAPASWELWLPLLQLMAALPQLPGSSWQPCASSWQLWADLPQLV